MSVEKKRGDRQNTSICEESKADGVCMDQGIKDRAEITLSKSLQQPILRQKI